MDELTYVLKQSIGIYYVHDHWKRWMFDKLKEYYSSIDYIQFVSYGSSNTRIELKDNTTIHFIFANERCRGRRFSKVIYERGIDESILKYIILPTLTAPMAVEQIMCFEN